MYQANNDARSSGEARVQEGRLRYQKQKTPKYHTYEEKDKAWMHWEYEPEDWALFEKVDWHRPRLIFWGLIAGTAASVIGAILPWFLFSPATDTGPLLSVYLPALLAWCVCVSMMFASLFAYIDARKRHKARQQEPRRVTFAREGLWEAGTFFPLNKSLEADLKKVTMTFDPPVLHFRLLRWHRGNNWRASPTRATLHVPVPRGHEEEAGFLQERFQTEVLQARIELEKRIKQPPEPS